MLILGGQPIRKPVAAYGLRDEHPRQLIQAFEDYQAGRLGSIGEPRPGHEVLGEATTLAAPSSHRWTTASMTAPSSPLARAAIPARRSGSRARPARQPRLAPSW